MTKVYAYRGKKNAEVHLRIGNTIVKVPFSGGRLDSRNPRPATYTTADPGSQQFIEATELFKRGIIYVYRTHGAPEVKAPAVASEPKAQTVNEASTWQEVVSVLKAKGAKASELKTREQAKKTASALGISFPNFSFED